MIALLPLDLPTTLPAPRLGAILRRTRAWSGQAPPSIPAPPAWSARVPGAPATSPLVSPHGTLPRYFGTRATRHAQCRLACDRPSPPVAPALPRKDDRGGTTAGTTGIKATTTDSKAKPPNDPILQLRHKSAAQPAPRPLPAGVPWV